MNELNISHVFSQWVTENFKSWNELDITNQNMVILNFTLIIGTLLYLIFLKYKKYREYRVNKRTTKRLEELNKESNQKAASLNITYPPQHLDLLTIENIERMRQHLDLRLTNLFDQFIITRLLFIFKQFGAVSIENSQKTKQEYIDLVEASLTLYEKEQTKLIFDSFPAFKLYLVQFYNIKLVKLELMITHKVEIDEKEFKDYILINSLCNDINKKDLKNILDILQ